MKKVFFILAMGCLLAVPSILRAEEIVIPLQEVVSMTPLPGDNPLDGPSQSGQNPPSPTDFIATINGNAFRVLATANPQCRRLCSQHPNRERCFDGTIYGAIINQLIKI